MTAKKVLTRHLLQTLGNDYFNIPLKERLHRLNAILPTRAINKDFKYEVI